MTIQDLGIGGATIETRFPLLIDSLHQLRISLDALTVVVKGRVVHSHISDVEAEVVSYHSGIEFVETPHHVQDAITVYSGQAPIVPEAAESPGAGSRKPEAGVFSPPRSPAPGE